ncbi:MAG: site-specific DNA-methyltransferase [Deltaproteobacteria bacterium]|nr:site-specific DNA-methyltransferase [Deltaproteobacteria bacterium]
MEPYYEHGGITIYHGDCREVLPGIEADAVVTDPPYGTGERLRVDGEFARTGQGWDEWRTDWLPQLKAGAVFCPPRRMPELAGWVGDRWRLLAWVSGNPAARKGVAPRYGIQPIVAWGCAGDGLLDWFRHRSNIQTGHPHEKPEPVMRWLVSLVPGTILDPFMGSGTTLRAAKDLGRKSIGIEIEERYCEIAAKRLAQEVLDFG